MFGDKRNRQNLIDFYLEFYDVYWIRLNFIALKSAIKILCLIRTILRHINVMFPLAIRWCDDPG